MKVNKAKEKLLSGEPVFECEILAHTPAIVEVLGIAGFDVATIDGEHGPLERRVLENMVRAAECADITPICYTALNYPAEIMPFLDTGVMGLKVPHVKTAEIAQMVVDAIKYAPLGKRGMTPGRANRYGVSGIPTQEYIAASNRQTLVVVMIEDVEAVKNLPQILRIEGIDVFNIGAGDLANSLGYTGQSAHAKVVEVVEHIMDQAHALGKVTSNPAPDAETRKRWFDKGARYITRSTDLRLFHGAAVARLQEIKDSLR